MLTLAELEARLHGFVVADYHQRLHSETGLTPQARWEMGGFLPRLPDSTEQLDLLLLTVAKTRRVHQDGIHFQGLRYLDLTLAALPELPHHMLMFGEWSALRMWLEPI